MSYTERQAAAFEEIHDALRASNKRYTVALVNLRRNRPVSVLLGGNPSMETLMALLRSHEYKEWFQDWLEVGTLVSAHQAFGKLSGVIAEAIGIGVRRHYQFELDELLKKHRFMKQKAVATVEQLGKDIDLNLFADEEQGHDQREPDPEEDAEAQDAGPPGEDELGPFDGEGEEPPW